MLPVWNGERVKRGQWGVDGLEVTVGITGNLLGELHRVGSNKKHSETGESFLLSSKQY